MNDSKLTDIIDFLDVESSVMSDTIQLVLDLETANVIQIRDTLNTLCARSGNVKIYGVEHIMLGQFELYYLNTGDTYSTALCVLIDDAKRKNIAS